MRSPDHQPNAGASIALEAHVGDDYYRIESALDERLGNNALTKRTLAGQEFHLRDAIATALEADSDPDAKRAVTRGVTLAKEIREQAIPGLEGRRTLFHVKNEDETDRQLEAIRRAQTLQPQTETFADDNPATNSLLESAGENHADKLDQARIFDRLAINAGRLALIAGDYQSMQREAETQAIEATFDGALAPADLYVPAEWSRMPDLDAVDFNARLYTPDESAWDRFQSELSDEPPHGG